MRFTLTKWRNYPFLEERGQEGGEGGNKDREGQWEARCHLGNCPWS